MALSVAAHWNQNEQDWRTMLALGRGWGLREPGGAGEPGGPGGAGGSGGAGGAGGAEGGHLVASTLVLPYGGHFAWISMVLVLPEARGRGHASRLLDVALQWLAAEHLLPVLDATPAGRPVYLKQGFVDDWAFARWRRAAGLALPAPQAMAKRDARVRQLRESDWPAVAALDAPAFGASRLSLLRRLWQRQPALGWVLDGGVGDLRAFVLGREGRTAMQLGPLVAVAPDDALALLQAAFDASQQAAGAALPSLIVDAREGQPEVEAWLQQHGFAVERRFTRMVRAAPGTPSAPGDAAHVVLVAGPELG